MGNVKGVSVSNNMKANAGSGLGAYLKTNAQLYIMLLPGLLMLFVFNYVPMYGVTIAFKDFDNVKGILDSPWLGLAHFEELFSTPDFYNVFINSLTLSLMRLCFGFPVPIILALMLNEVRSVGLKRVSQTLLYLPHFISWVVIAGIVYKFLAPTGSVLSHITTSLNLPAVTPLQDPRFFRWVIVLTDIWKEAGWGSIIYLAAIAGVSEELYEAAIIDGAGRLRRIWSITLPCIASTIIVMLTLRMGSLLRNGFEQIFLLYNPMVYSVADVLETFTYRLGLQEGRFDFATAVGIFQSITGMILIFTSNVLAKKQGEGGIF